VVHAAGTGSAASARERDLDVAADEPVTSPDQHKPGPRRAARVGAIGTVVLLVMMAFCAHGGVQEGRIGLLYLALIAVLIVGVLVGDWVLRKNGLRR
jgi:hypothetical protein